MAHPSLLPALKAAAARGELLCGTAADEIERLRAALENAEQFLDLYINGASSVEDAKHTLAHVHSALGTGEQGGQHG